MTIQEVITRSKNARMPNCKMHNKKHANEDFTHTIRDMMDGTIKVRSYHGKKKGWSWSVFFIKHCIKCSEPVFIVSSKVKGKHTALKGDSICESLKCRASDTGWYVDNSPQSHTYGYMIKLVYEEKKSGKYKGNLHRTKITQHRWIMEQYLGKEALFNMHIHHIDMKKLNNNISNLWVCTSSEHFSAHHSFNHCCEELMGNFDKYCDIKFNIETGKYYLINKEAA